VAYLGTKISSRQKATEKGYVKDSSLILSSVTGGGEGEVAPRQPPRGRVV
jgi:hypothetical protein